jgi:NAD-dependent DNA ligase
MKKLLASNRQLKLLTFFGESLDGDITNEKAHQMISRIFFAKPHYRELWAKYKFLTGDEDYESPNLKPFDLEELIDLTLPEDWNSSTSRNINSKVLELVVEELKLGVPFEDPEPKIHYSKNHFVLSGIFSFGIKNECYQKIIQKGGEIGKNVTRKTRYLIIGGTPNPNWSNEGYGNKIEKAFCLKLSGEDISVISEAHWQKSL